jgi:hypothetical protein
MVRLFSRLFKKKPEINIGKIDPNFKVKRKVVNKDEKQLRVSKVNSKTQFYSVKLNKSEILHLSVLGKKLIKKYPELLKFISKNISFESKYSKYSTKTFNLEIRKLKNSDGYNNLKILKLDLFLKDKMETKSFFLKVTQEDYLANNEFLANQVFQKYGINTIKPHFAFTNISKRESVIVYDFTNLNNLKKDLYSGKISEKEIIEIKNKINFIKNHDKLPTSPDYYKKSIGDFENYSNIFYQRNKNGNLDIYFTDLLVGVKSFAY